MRTQLCSISEAARQLGHDRRTIKQITDLAEPKVITNHGPLYSLDDIRNLLMIHKPRLRTDRQSLVRQFTDI